MKKQLLIGALLISVILISACTSYGYQQSPSQPVYELYDSFSGTILDNTKWVEENLQAELNEHYIDTVTQTYHQAAIGITGDRETSLTLTRRFNASETLDYDVYYNSGSGNLLSRVWINDRPGDGGDVETSACGPYTPELTFATGGAIGYWNGVSCIGQDVKGKYHIRIEFQENSVNVIFIDPNNNVIGYTPIYSMSVPPFKIAISTRTGHNGIGHIDYDNFIINKDYKPTKPTTGKKYAQP